MGYKQVSPKDDSGRTPNEPHPDWLENKRILNEVLLLPKVMCIISNNDMTVRWCGNQPVGKDKDFNTIYEIYTHLELSWHKNNKLYAIPISLHKSTQVFKEEVEKIFYLQGEL